MPSHLPYLWTGSIFLPLINFKALGVIKSLAEPIQMWQIFMDVLVNWDVLFGFSVFSPLAVYCRMALGELFLSCCQSVQNRLFFLLFF